MRGFYSKAHFGAEKTHIGSLFLEKMHFGAEKKIIGSLFLATAEKRSQKPKNTIIGSFF